MLSVQGTALGQWSKTINCTVVSAVVGLMGSARLATARLPSVLMRQNKDETLEAGYRCPNPSNFEMYHLSLIRSRKCNWLHGGSIPLFPTDPWFRAVRWRSAKPKRWVRLP